MNEFQHCVPKQVGVLAVDEAPRHFVEIGRQMLCRDPMPRSHDPALKQTESRFHGIRVNVAANANPLPVLDPRNFHPARSPTSWEPIHPVTSTTAATGAVHFKLSRFRRG